MEATGNQFQFKLFAMRAEKIAYRCAYLLPLSTSDDEHEPMVCVGVLTVTNEVYARSIQEEIDTQGKYQLGQEP